MSIVQTDGPILRLDDAARRVAGTTRSGDDLMPWQADDYGTPVDQAAKRG
jgi:hypothetical protein